VHEIPNAEVTDVNTGLAQLGKQAPQREIGCLSQPARDPIQPIRQQKASPATHRKSRWATLSLRAIKPALRRRLANLIVGSSLITAQPAPHRRNNTFA